MIIPEVLLAKRVIPVVVIDDATRAQGLADAMIAGGLPVAEVTFRTAAAGAAIAALTGRDDLLVGAGTVLDPVQVDQAAGAGAAFIVTPGTSLPVIERALERGLPVLPGAVTATEIQAVLALGIGTVKFFPAETSGGVAAIKALSAPFQQVKFVPTGGVGPANLADYLAVPAVAAVGGSWMVPPAVIQAGDFEQIRTLCAEAVQAARVREL